MRLIMLYVFVIILTTLVVYGFQNNKDACGKKGICECKIYPANYKVNCSNRSLSNLPKNIPISVTELYLSHNNINTLPKETFWKFHQLRKLDLSFNKLGYIPNDVLVNNTKLQYLDFSFNKLDYIPNDVLANNTKLQYFFLRKNSVKNLPNGLFWTNQEILNIKLSQNTLENISENMFLNNGKLLTVYLSSNNISNLAEKTFRNNLNLIRLDVSRNHLKSIPEYIFETNVKLKYLSLSHNIINTLPKETFWKCHQLRKLDFSFNKLGYIPNDVLANNTKLQYFFFHHNSIKNLPNDLFWTNQEILKIYLSFNKLVHIPNDLLANNTKLQSFFVKSNSVKNLPNDLFWTNQEIKNIDLSYNALDNISENMFSNNRKLLFVFLSSNNISSLAEKTFRNNLKLKILNVSRNHLNGIPEYIFETNVKLTDLHISYNNLLHIPNDLIAKNTNLKFFDLSRNKLGNISENIFSNNTKLTCVYLNNNNITKIGDKSFRNNRKLARVHLSGNLLKQIPRDCFANLPELKFLELQGNNLEQLPVEIFKNTTKLEIVYLSSNKLRNILPGTFSSTINLKQLDLGNNNLEELPDKLLYSTPKLISFQLCSNYIRTLPKDLFASVRGLEYLTLCKNRLSEIRKIDFQGSKHLYYLSIWENNISSLPTDLFSDVILDETVFLSDNKLNEIPVGLFCSKQCSHKLKWLFLQNNHLTFLLKDCFKGLPNLTHIFLHSNNIAYLGNDVFAGTSIRNLYIFSNNIKSITNNSLSNTFIREIHIYKNPLETISQHAFSERTGKVMLYLYCNELTQLPWLGRNITSECLKKKLPPSIDISGKYTTPIRAALIEDGFNCTPGKSETQCRPCPPGTYGDGTAGCKFCPAGGYYQDDFGHLSCKLCHSGTFVNRSKGRSIQDCELCPEGTNLARHAGHRACFCKVNYARTHRFRGCALCLEEGINCLGDYKSLKPGYYWNWSFRGANITGYSNFVSYLENDTMEYCTSCIEYRLKVPKAHKCPISANCENHGGFLPEEIQGTCKDGYQGWLCSKCQAHFYSVLNICLRCPAKIWIILEVFALVCLGVSLYVFLLWQRKREEKKHTKERSLFNKILSQMKIVLGFYQVVGELLESFHDITWIRPLQFVGQLISVLKVSILRVIIRPHCYNEQLKIDAKLQFIIWLSFPIVMSFLLTFVYNILKIYFKYKRRHNIDSQLAQQAKIKDKLFTYALLLLFITYPPTCDAIFKLYPGACKTFYIYENSTEVNVTLLRSDFDIQCSTLKTYQLLAYVATGVYVTAFPFVLLVLLYKFHKTTVKTFIDDENSFNDEIQSIYTPSEESCLLSSNSQDVVIPAWISFLCENYKPKFWYWEVLELARKVIQTMLVTLFAFEDALTKLLTIGASVLFLTLHARLSPMKSPFEQRLQMFSLAVIFINVLIASIPIPESYQGPISTMLIALNTVIFLVIAGEIILSVVRYVRQTIHRVKVR